MANRWITETGARRCALVATILAVGLAIVRTFFDQDLIAAVIGVSSASVFYWAYRNPKMLLSENWDEFCKHYDGSRDLKYLWGFPLFQVLLLAVILYIWLV